MCEIEQQNTNGPLIIEQLNVWLKEGIFETCPMLRDASHFRKATPEQDVAMNCDIIVCYKNGCEGIVGLRTTYIQRCKRNPEEFGFYDNMSFRTQTTSGRRDSTEFSKDLYPYASRAICDIHAKYDPFSNKFVKLSIISGELKRKIFERLNPETVYKNQKVNDDGSAFLTCNNRFLENMIGGEFLRDNFWEYEFKLYTKYKRFPVSSEPEGFVLGYWYAAHEQRVLDVWDDGKIHQGRFNG